MTDFRIGVQVILLQNRRILLGLRQNCYGHETWGLPGGHLDPGESFEQAATREVYEETGLRIATPRVFGVANDPSPHAHHVQIGLLAREWLGQPELCEPNRCAEWQFWPLSALPTPLFSSSIPLIDQYVRLPNHRRARAIRRPAQTSKRHIAGLDRLALNPYAGE